MDKLKNVFFVFFSVAFIWIFMSFIDVNIHDVLDLDCARWNLFVLVFPDEINPKEELQQCENVFEEEVVSETKEPLPTNVPIEKNKKSRANKRKRADKKDILALARIIQAENGGHKDDEALLLTGVVVMKRVKSDEYPDTIMGVISQRGQYATYEDGTFWNNPSKRSRRIARKILETDIADKYPDNLVFQAEFKQGSAVYKKLGYEYFCLL